MIRVRKSTVTPPSLLAANCNKHDEQDVQDALMLESDKKCYLCEQYVNKTFQIEHNKAQTVQPHLRYEWSNLFMSCGYCNGRKSGGYDVLDPATNNIEDLITHHLDLSRKFITFNTDHLNPQTLSTVELLSKLFNGKNNLRDVKCKVLYEDLQREYVSFLQFLLDYKQDDSPLNKQKVIDSLSITKEFLAFKYWLIKGDAVLFGEFGQYMIWNKRFHNLVHQHKF